jgi:hypothetical protein
LTIREIRIDPPVAANFHPRCAAAGATSRLVVVFMGAIVACELGYGWQARLRVFTAGPSITAGVVPIPNDQLFLASRRGIGGSFGRPTTTGIASHLRIFCLALWIRGDASGRRCGTEYEEWMDYYSSADGRTGHVYEMQSPVIT